MWFFKWLVNKEVYEASFASNIFKVDNGFQFLFLVGSLIFLLLVTFSSLKKIVY